MFVRRSGSYKIAELTGRPGSVGQLNGRKLAVVSGAGPSGLSAAFELRAKGFEVVVVEKRSEFSRFNVINLNRESQAFLRKFNLLKEFEASVASRIKEHQIVVFGKGDPRSLSVNDVSELQFEGTLEKDPSTFKDLFQEDGIYSVQIKDLQAFLAQKAVTIGIQILSDSEIEIVSPLEEGRVSRIEIKQNRNPDSSLMLQPDLLLIAEGTRSQLAQSLGMVEDSTDVVDNVCTGENWIFGNMDYRGNKTFVISMVITAQKTLQIANVIFNAKCQLVNVAVTSEENPQEDEIKSLIAAVAKKAFMYGGIEGGSDVLESVKQPVHIINRRASQCSRGNVFRIGDAVGNSSPLAGLGGTLGLTLVPATVEQLLEDLEGNPDRVHCNFQANSQGYVNKWIDKSESVKKAILGIKEAEYEN